MCASRERANNGDANKHHSCLSYSEKSSSFIDPAWKERLNGSPARHSGQESEPEAKTQQQQQQQPQPKLEDDWLHRTARKIPRFGILLAFGASFFLGSAGMLVKMTNSVHGIQVAVIRAFIQMIIYLALIWARKLPLMPERDELYPVLGRVTLGAASITCSYFALKLIPLGDATVIRFSLPIWTLIVGYLVLHESCGLLKIGAVLVSLSGVTLMAKPALCVYLMHKLLNSLHLESDLDLQLSRETFAAAHQSPFSSQQQQQQQQLVHSSTTTTTIEELPGQFEGCMLALSSSICLALSLIALRLCQKTPVELTILWLSLFSMALGTVCLLLLGEWHLPDNLPDCGYILLNGLCGAIGQWFISSALKVEQSGVISLARTFDIQVAFMYSAFLLHEQIQTTSIIGSLLVSSGVLAVVLPRWTCQSAQRKVNASDLEGNASTIEVPLGDALHEEPAKRNNNNSNNNNNKMLA